MLLKKGLKYSVSHAFFNSKGKLFRNFEIYIGLT